LSSVIVASIARSTIDDTSCGVWLITGGVPGQLVPLLPRRTTR
jgi:hypothetical protein